MGRSVARAAVLAAVVSAFVGLVGLGPIAAFPLSNCTLQATSTDAGGGTLGSASSGAADATQADPFIVDWNGSVTWTGTTGGLEMKNNAWHIDVFGLPTPLRGGDDNSKDNRDGNGTVGIGANAPFRITGLYFVSGSITGSGGTCAGSGWLKLAGDPVGTIPFFVGLVLAVIGALLLARGARGHRVSAVVGGLVLGLAAAIEAVIFSFVPIGSTTPILALALGLLIGIIVAIAGRSRPAVAT
jgi:hypothetical protein